MHRVKTAWLSGILAGSECLRPAANPDLRFELLYWFHGLDSGSDSLDALGHGGAAHTGFPGQACLAASAEELLQVSVVAVIEGTAHFDLDPFIRCPGRAGPVDDDLLGLAFQGVSFSDSTPGTVPHGPIGEGAHIGEQCRNGVSPEAAEGAVHAVEQDLSHELLVLESAKEPGMTTGAEPDDPPVDVPGQCGVQSPGLWTSSIREQVRQWLSDVLVGEVHGLRPR